VQEWVLFIPLYLVALQQRNWREELPIRNPRLLSLPAVDLNHIRWSIMSLFCNKLYNYLNLSSSQQFW
jgi:hypothetical protein